MDIEGNELNALIGGYNLIKRTKPFIYLENDRLDKSKELGLLAEFSHSNIEGEIVNIIQDSIKNFDGIIINAAAFTHICCYKRCFRHI